MLSNFNTSVQEYELERPKENLENWQKEDDVKATGLNEATSRGTNQEIDIKILPKSQLQEGVTVIGQQSNKENIEQFCTDEEANVINVAIAKSTSKEA